MSGSIVVERIDGTWRSIGSEMNTFMPLRRGIADDPYRILPLTPDASVMLVTNSDQDLAPDAVTNVLDQQRCQIWTGV